MKFLVLIFILSTLIACSAEQDAAHYAKPNGPNSGGQDDNKPESARKNTTNYSVCGTGDAKLTTPEGRWEIFETENEAYFKVALEFKNNSLTLRQDCFRKGLRLTASTTVPAKYTGGTLEVLADNSDTVQSADTNNKFDCKVNLTKGISSYGFAGNCLELNAFQGRPYLKFAPQ